MSSVYGYTNEITRDEIKALSAAIQDLSYMPLIEGSSLPTYTTADHKRRAHTTSDDDRLHIGLDGGWNRIITADHNDEVLIDTGNLQLNDSIPCLLPESETEIRLCPALYP